MSKNDLLSDFQKKMQSEENYLKINQLKDGFCYKIWARNAYVGVWDEAHSGFVIVRYKGSSAPRLSIEYHWDYDEQFGTAKPIHEIQKCPIPDHLYDKITEELIEFLLTIEKNNPVVEGCDTVELRRKNAVNFGQRLAGKGEHKERVTKEPIWKRLKFEYRYKPKKCPKCKSSRVATILWGMPAFSDDLQEKIDAGKIVLGGCCLSNNDPKWKCADCGAEIFKKEKSSHL